MRIRASFFIVLAVLLSLRFKAEAALPSPITLAWNPSANAVSYTLYWGGQSGNYSLNQSCQAPQTSLTIAILTNQVYYFAVTATDGTGNESPKSVELVYMPPVPPAVPGGLAVSGPSGGGATAGAGWNLVTNAATYELYWGTVSGQYTQSNSITQPHTSLNVTGLLPNQTYYFAVAALGSNGIQSALSSPFAYANALAVNQPPTNSSPTNNSPTNSSPTNVLATVLAAPGNFTELAVTNNGVAGLALSWGGVANAVGYGLSWGTNSQTYIWSSNCPSSQTEVTLTNLIGGETYYLAVMALSTGGTNNSAFSPELVYTDPIGTPANFAVSSASGNVTASWNSVADAAGYAVFYGTQSGAYLVGASCAAGQTNLSVTNLVANKVYYFAVAALATNGNQGAYSAQAIFTNTVAIVTSPFNQQPPVNTGGGQTTTGSDTGLVTLSPLAIRVVPGSAPNTAVATWGPQAGGGTYVLYEWPGTLANYQNNSSVSTVANQPSASVAGLATNQSYVFTVYSVAANIWGTPVVYVNSTNMVNAPTNFAVAPANGGGTALWSPVAGAAGYTVYYGTQSGVYLTSANCSSGQTNLSVTNLTTGSVYYFAVASLGANGNPGAYSPEVVFTNTGSAVVELLPLEAAVTPGSAPNTALVIWGGESGVGTYVLFQWPGTLADYQNNNSLSTVATGTNMLVGGLTPGQSYVFSVFAVDASSWGSPVAYTNPLPPPPVPSGFGVSGGAAASSALAVWSSVAAAGGYELYWGTNSGNYTLSNNLPVSQTSMTVTGLATNQTYYFAVAAMGTNGTESALSPGVSYFNAAPVPPAIPGAFAVSAGAANNSAMANWSPAAGAGGYELYWGTSSGNYTLSNSLPVTQTSMTVPGLAASQTYYFAVASLGTNGMESAFSPEVSYLNAAATPPAVPSGFAVSAGAPTNSAMANWSPVAGAGGYELYWGTQSGNYTFSNNLPVSQTGMTVAGLTTNQTYYFAVASLGTNGTESGFSPEVSYFNTAPITPTFAASTNQVPGIPPMLALCCPNQQANLVISGTVGAQMKIQATTNVVDPLSWTTIDTITLTNAVTNVNSGSTNGLPEILLAAFVPAAQVYVPAMQVGTPAQAYRVCMPYDYATLAYQVLPMTNYPTRLIGVYMPGLNNNVCYVTNQYNFIYCDPQTFNVDVQGSGPAIRQIATSLAGTLSQNWTTAVELMYTNGVYQLLATVVETDPVSSDQVAGQQAPSSIQINF